MTHNDKGKLCASCQKTVVDFSIMTDAEIIHYFESYNGATCGGFTEKQLSAPISVSTFGKPQRHWAWALSALLLPEVLISSQDLPTGTFMYSLFANGKVLKTHKMVVVKN